MDPVLSNNRHEYSAYFVQTLSQVWNLDPNLVEALKYEIDGFLYYYGEQWRNPCVHRPYDSEIRDRFERDIVAFDRLAGLLEQHPSWEESILLGPDPIVVGNAYFSWREGLERSGLRVHVPLWNAANTISEAEIVLSNLCRLVKDLFAVNFRILVDQRFHSMLQRTVDLLARFYSREQFLGLVVPYTNPFFEYVTVDIFQQLGKKTFLAIHGLPEYPEWWRHGEHAVDYLVVWGRALKEQIVATGFPRERVLISGHPDYHEYTVPRLKSDLSAVLVLAKVCGGGKATLNLPIYQNRAYSVDYIYRIQQALSAVGVTKARLRPHPSESCEWYSNMVDTNFWVLDSGPLAEALRRSTLVIGSATTVFVESLLAGVNYHVFDPTNTDYNPCNYPCVGTVAPFDGTDERVAWAGDDETLQRLLKENRMTQPEVLLDYISPQFRPDVIREALVEARDGGMLGNGAPA